LRELREMKRGIIKLVKSEVGRACGAYVTWSRPEVLDERKMAPDSMCMHYKPGRHCTITIELRMPDDEST